MTPRLRAVLLAALLGVGPLLTGAAPQPWSLLPQTPVLPRADQTGTAELNGIRLWYASFGHGPAVILLHGGLANGNYWGLQVSALRGAAYRVIVVDSRGHGRSTLDEKPLGYDLMASDVLALMDRLALPRAAVVGWSDGAIIGLDLAMHHPERIACLFAFAADSDVSGVKDVGSNSVFRAYLARTGTEYRSVSPTPNRYAALLAKVTTMWTTQPHFTAAQLRGITTPTWIVDGDHDEAIKLENTVFMAEQIPDAGLLMLPEVSHFAFLQDPVAFNAEMFRFLEHTCPKTFAR